MLTKRQQEILLVYYMIDSDSDSLLGASFRSTTPGKPWQIPCTQAQWDADILPATTERTIRILSDIGLLGFQYKRHDRYAHLTPTGTKLAAILAKLPRALTRRQWEVLLRFRDVGSDSSSTRTCSFRSSSRKGNYWYTPSTLSEWNDTMSQGTNERTIRTLCDYGLLGFEYMEIGPTPYAHLSPLGHELVNLLPTTVRR